MRHGLISLLLIFVITDRGHASQDDNDGGGTYLGIISAGVMANAVVDGSGTTIFTARTVQGIQLNDHVSFGVAVGFERFATITFIPLLLDFRAYIPYSTVSPFVVLEGGYSAASNRKGSISSGGILLDVGGGIKFSITRTLSLLAELGYEHQDTQEEHLTSLYDSRSGIYRLTTFHLDMPYNMLIAKLGISF